MANVTATSQCPKCNAPLEFVPETGMLVCEYCNSSFTPQEIDAYNADKQAKAAAAFEKEQAQGQDWVPPDDSERVDAEGDAGESEGSYVPDENAPDVIPPAEKAVCIHSKWDDSTISPDWGEESQNVCTYSCASCGGEIICEATTGATQCPYCGNPTIVPGQFSVGRKPNLVIPFKLTKEQAEAALKQHYRGKLFLPKEFTNENQIKKLQGTYVPFWLFNGTCAAECSFHCTRSHSHRSGDYIITNTDHYRADRHGVVPFSKVPADASTKMPDDMMDSIEPYDYSELAEFSTAYLPGFVADKYDVEIDDCSNRADWRCENTTLQLLQKDVTGYESVTRNGKSIYMNRGNVDYALLPVWTMKTQYKDKTYLFAMNGQTGKLVGDLPVDKGRYWAFCLLLTLVIAIVLYVVGVGNALADLVWQIVAEW